MLRFGESEAKITKWPLLTNAAKQKKCYTEQKDASSTINLFGVAAFINTEASRS